MMIANLKEREKEILNMLYEDQSVSISQLCDHFGVTVVTLRKDLDKLESNGLIVRTHGGAVPVFDRTINERMKFNSEEKHAIAKAAANLISDGDRVMISAGTTSSLIMRYLFGKRNIHIVTNSTLLLTYSRINPAISVTLIGGEFMTSAEAISGSSALKQLSQFHVSKSFIGSDGFSLVGGATADHYELAEVCKQMIRCADEPILLVDSSKLGKRGFAFIGELEKFHTIITRNLPTKEIELLAEMGVKNIIHT